MSYFLVSDPGQSQTLGALYIFWFLAPDPWLSSLIQSLPQHLLRSDFDSVYLLFLFPYLDTAIDTVAAPASGPLQLHQSLYVPVNIWALLVN